MKLNPEYQLAVAFKAYLEDALDAADFTTWPVVTWFDPMAIDAGNRVVCICQSARTHDTQTGNFSAEIEIGVRTEFAQPTVQTDTETHFDRVAQVRDALGPAVTTLADSLATFCNAGFTVSFVDSQRELTTEVNEDNFYSATKLSVECHATEE